MAPLQSFFTDAESVATELGHTIVWETVGEIVANGKCSHCGRRVTVAVSPARMHELVGEAVEQKCDAAGNIMQRASRVRKVSHRHGKSKRADRL